MNGRGAHGRAAMRIGPVMSREWAMPSRHTFTIRPIRNLIARWTGGRCECDCIPIRWVDPFAGYHSPAFYTNDIDPDSPAKMHLDAPEFIQSFSDIEGLLFDPPYSPRQLAECYKAASRHVGRKETQNGALYAAVKDAAADRMRPGSLAICCGWNSNGMGTGRGFEMLEILTVAHGAAHNDTIVTVERKVRK